MNSPKTFTATDRSEDSLCRLRAVHVYVPWSVARCTFSICNVPLKTRCHMFVGSRTFSRSHVIVSMGYPATGHFIVNALPAIAEIASIGRTYGGPTIYNKTEKKQEEQQHKNLFNISTFHT